MRVRDMAIDDIHPYPNNPRQNDDAVAAVAASIQEFGFKQPIVVDADLTVIVGHTRLKAAESLGLESVPVLVADDLTAEQVAADRLADNRTGELAEWDLDLLDVELDGLVDFDMGRFGFDDVDFTLDGADESFELKEGDGPAYRTITLGMTEEQFQVVRPALDAIDPDECTVRGGNADGDRVCEVIRQWAQKS